MKIIQLGTGKVLWEGADLSGANLYGADLSGADLSGADLTRADLTRADLSGANLYGADLSGANLYGADLSGANLTRADLSGANLYGADLSGANLVVGPQRSDGYRFVLIKEPSGIIMVSAGCRYFTFKDAISHWKATRKGTMLGKESLAILAYLKTAAKIAGWKV